MKSIQAPFLQKNDIIGIISTARSVDKSLLEKAIHILKSWGLQVMLGKNLYRIDNQFAGTIQERTNDLQNMINNPQIKAIFCAKGGYGTIQIVDNLDLSTLYSQPKWIIGFSDVTVLHNHLHTQLNLQTIHATMPLLFSQPNHEMALEHLKNVLFGKFPTYTFPSYESNREGKTIAPIIGGNLSIIHSLIGTPSDIDTKGKILFLEDLDEYLYHIDRMIIHLKRAKKLDKLAGLVIGGMTDMKDNMIPFGKNAEQIIYDYTKEYDYPICFNAPIGHIVDNFPIICGKKMELIVEKNESHLIF